MFLCAGNRLGPYEVLAQIGEGGMGEVYRARDTRLHRTVAIKIIKGEFGERFEREAQAISALNHPHICTLYDVGSLDGLSYLVMEYVEGDPLKNPLPLAEALRVAVEIADALAASHGKGIVHRDLKPANILMTRTGVKLLDFGLAGFAPTDIRVSDATITTPLTGQGQILGTLHYMSPEQLEGKRVDARSDIFSFGLVLYEMLTGRRAFEGSNQASLIAAILKEEPPPLTSLQPLTPPALERTVRKCLAKDPSKRWQTIADLRDELSWLAEEGAVAITEKKSTRSRWREGGWIAAAVLLGVCVFLAISKTGIQPAGELTRFAVYPPEKTTFAGQSNATVPALQFALSPDGRVIVFAASAAGAKPRLWVRQMEEISARPLPGTENGAYPFWSPDSRWIGFFTEGKLMKITADGTVLRAISEDLADLRGGSWAPDDTILLGFGGRSVHRVPSGGGSPEPVTKLDTSRQEGSHRWPQFLPGGRHFLYTIRSGLAEQRGVYAGSLDGKTKKFLVRSDLSALYASPGYLLYMDGDTLLGQAFDSERLELRGQPFTIAQRIGISNVGNAAVSVSSGGMLAYAGALSRLGRLTWLERDGAILHSIGPEGDYTDFRLSPDERRLAASLVDPKRAVPDIWLIDFARGSTSRFTFGPSINSAAIWSPDGSQLLFRTGIKGLVELYQKSAAGGGDEAPVLLEETQRAAGLESALIIPTDWSPDGRQIIFAAAVTSSYDLWLLPIGGDRQPVKFLSAPADQLQGNFSPDGRLVAYSSNESGAFEVYVETFPRSDRKLTISTNGGYEPRWRADGREIFYLAQDQKLMAVSVGAGPSFGVPKPLFQARVATGINAFRTNYVPSRDGQRFLINQQVGDPEPIPITVVLNWTAGLKR